MSKIDQLYDNKAIQNIFVWFVIFIILAGASNENGLVTSLIAIMLLMPPIYIHNLFILPLLKRNRALYFIFFFINAAIFTGVIILFLIVILDQVLSFRMLNMFGIVILGLIFGAAMKLARDSFQRRQQEKEVELKLLKGQLNPHFLFNTLNNLYGLSVTKSDKLPPLMLKLSELLRYSLYETKAHLVPIEREISYLANYIALETIRLEDKVSVNFNKNLSSTDHSKNIAPMLLIVFVENAFKHLDTVHRKVSKVEIDISIEKDVMQFSCLNTMDSKSKAVDPDLKESGIGLGNAKKRLDLIYPGRYDYKVTEENDEFLVNLTLHLI